MWCGQASEIFQQRIPEIIALETKETASSSGFAGFETAVSGMSHSLRLLGGVCASSEAS